MSKYWSFPRQTRCEISDPTHLLKWRQMYSKPGVQDTSRELIYRAFSHHHTSVPRTVAPLIAGFMQLVHVRARVCVLGLMSLSWLDSWISLFPVSLSVSLSQARIIPTALTWRHTYSDRALRQPVTHYLHSAAAPCSVDSQCCEQDAMK